MLEALGKELDEELLREFLRTEDAEDALDALRKIAASGRAVDHQVLRDMLTPLHRKETDQ